MFIKLNIALNKHEPEYEGQEVDFTYGAVHLAVSDISHYYRYDGFTILFLKSHEETYLRIKESVDEIYALITSTSVNVPFNLN